MATPRPSLPQALALRRMLSGDGTVRRLPGGYRVSGNIALRPAGGPLHNPGQALIEVWADIQTIRAMERRGWIERTHTLPEEWTDPRRLTAAGRSLLAPS